MSKFQHTIKDEAAIEGIGLHFGKMVKVRFFPAPPDTGVVFIKYDGSKYKFIKAGLENVVDTRLSTSIGAGSLHVHTVEHMAAAFSGLGIDNIYILIDGPESPIMDGSAKLFVELFENTGIIRQNVCRKYLKIEKEVHLKNGGQQISVYPGDERTFSYTLNYPHKLLYMQNMTCSVNPDTFSSEIADARTFCFFRDIETMKKNGLAKGGSMDNAIVIGEDEILNESGLRFHDEFARHKILDMIGDFSLIGMPVLGHIVGEGSGHQMNVELAKKIFDDHSIWSVTECDDRVENFVQQAVEV